jgi:hypothetical protein
VIIGGLLLVIFLGLYFAFSLNGHLNRQLRDLDDHKQRCFDAIARPRGAAERQGAASSAAANPSRASPDLSPRPAAGVLKRFSIR